MKVNRHKHLDSVVTLIVQRYPELLEMFESPDRKETPLYAATLGNRSSMVLALMKGFKDSKQDRDLMRNVLALQAKEENTCLHIAFEKPLEENAIQAMLEFADDAVLAARDSEGFTPLHLAVHFNGGSPARTKTVLQMLRLSSTALSIRSKSGLSIYQRHITTRSQEHREREARKSEVTKLKAGIDMADGPTPQKSTLQSPGKIYQAQRNQMVSSPRMMDFPADTREHSRGRDLGLQVRNVSPALWHECDPDTSHPLVPGSDMEVSQEMASDTGSANRRDTIEMNQSRMRQDPKRRASIRDGEIESRIGSNHVARQRHHTRARTVHSSILPIDVRKFREKDVGDHADESALEQKTSF